MGIKIKKNLRDRPWKGVRNPQLLVPITEGGDEFVSVEMKGARRARITIQRC